jgi:hypothetical protein
MTGSVSATGGGGVIVLIGKEQARIKSGNTNIIIFLCMSLFFGES